MLTPHAGEMARLLGAVADGPTARDRDSLERAAAEMAAAIDAVVVLKGPGTLVVSARHRARNETGNPGMATAGTGDVLTGVIAALVGQRTPPLVAAWVGAYLHGQAGDLVAERTGEAGMLAREVADAVPRARLAALSGTPSGAIQILS